MAARPSPLLAHGPVLLDPRIAATPEPERDPGRASAHPASAAGDEAMLCRLFAQVTGQAESGRETDFFSIGGDSLAAMVLVTELRQLGRQLTLETLHGCRTPAAIAAAWSRGSGRPGEAKTRPTLFLIPGSGGDDPRLAALRAGWAGILDCVLLDYPDWRHLADPGFDLEALVAGFAGRIAREPASGPVLLAGYSIGGLVAWPLAARLAQMGRPPEALFILDTDARRRPAGGSAPPTAAPAPDRKPPLAGRIGNRLARFATLLRERDHARTARMLGEVVGFRLIRRLRLLRWLGRFRRVRLPAGFRYALHRTISAELHSGVICVRQGGMRIDPKPAALRTVVLFRTGATEPGETADLGWARGWPQLQIEPVTGDHLSMVEQRGQASLQQSLPRILRQHGLLWGLDR